MADIKPVSMLDEAASAASTDLMHVATDIGGGLYLSKKIAVSSLKSDLLRLDQTIPQSVTGGAPVFQEGVDINTIPVKQTTWTLDCATNVISLWKFNDNLTDEQGVGNGTEVGTVAYVYGLGGRKALSLDRTNYVEIPNEASYDAGTEITVGAWIWLDSLTAGSQGIISKYWSYTGFTNNRSYALDINSSGFPVFFYSANGSTAISLASTTPIPIRSWVHVAAMFKASTLVGVYINGVRVIHTSTTVTGLYNNADIVRIGCDFNPATISSRFGGYIQDAFVASVAMSEDQIREVMTRGVSNNRLEVDGYAKFDRNVKVEKLHVGDGEGHSFSIDLKSDKSYGLINSDSGYSTKLVDRPTFTSTGNLALAAGGTNLGIGAYHYSVTYVTAIGETNVQSNAVTITTDASNRKVTVTVPVSDDYRVIARKIYRSAVGGGQYNNRLVATIYDNTTTTYLDNVADASLGTVNAYFKDNTTVKWFSGNTTFMTPGSSNTRFGINAGRDSATGGRNTFVGNLCAAFITTGSDNVGVGGGLYACNPAKTTAIGQYAFGAVNSSTEVINSVAVGAYSMFTAFDSTTRYLSYSVAVGAYAGVAGLGRYSVAVGYEAGRNFYAANGYNTFVGYQSGRGGTGANGINNTSLGAFSLYGLTTGSSNIGIGVRAGEHLTTETDNVIIGLQAGRFVTSVSNLFIGSYAGTGVSSQSTGTHNIGIGYGSYRYFTTATSNVGIGHWSGENNTTGSYNVNIGINAGRYFTTGNYNVFLGLNSGISNNTDKGTGNGNTGLGGYSLTSLTSGLGNTGVGYAAGFTLTTGQANIHIGRLAGRYSTTESGELFVNSYDQGSRALEITDSLIYGVMADNAPASQSLRINAGNVYLPHDNEKLWMGSGNDISFTYNGTDLVLNTKEVGTGSLYLDATAGTMLKVGSNPTNTYAGYKQQVIIDGGVNTDTNSGNSIKLFIYGNSNDAGDDVYPIMVMDENDNKLFWLNGGSTGGTGTAYFGGYVGIGITPVQSEKLEISGNLMLYTNNKAIFGSAKNATIYYDGNNLVIDPQEIGSGFLDVGSSISCGGTASGVSEIEAGLTVNNGQTGTSIDDLTVKTLNYAAAFVVDASADSILAQVPIICGGSQNFSISYDGTTAVMDSGLVAPSDFKIDCGTEKTLILTDVVWDDVRVTPGSFDRPGNSDPTIVAYDVNGGGINTYLWQFATDNIATFAVQLPHGYKQGENINVHIHWTPGPNGVTESGNTVGWKVDYSWASINGNFGTMATANLSDACDGTNHKHQMTPSVTLTGADKNISSMLICNVKRTDTGTDDTWAGTASGERPMLLEVDFHFPIDTIGSRQEGVK